MDVVLLDWAAQTTASGLIAAASADTIRRPATSGVASKLTGLRRALGIRTRSGATA